MKVRLNSAKILAKDSYLRVPDSLLNLEMIKKSPNRAAELTDKYDYDWELVAQCLVVPYNMNEAVDSITQSELVGLESPCT
ncbi:hypothetical protein KIN20_020584 [Parelaphostrongylus tenuis]|uniref:Uncharacterized protein n=1 Tax=Parelaphostrongylus tenuis TaxID=148309 RepID=A0AAD5QTL2_PARTN|nr:hypothetical protein KIN20_020584 [Parelaphostrongylus tenuis]